MQPRRLLNFLLVPLFLAGAFLAGCTTPDRGEGLNQRLVAITLPDLPRDATTGEITVEVSNSTVIPYVIGTSAHKVFLEGKLIGEAKTDVAWGVQQQNRSQHKASLTLNAGVGADEVRALLATGKANYRLESRLVSRLGEDETVFKIQSAGVVDAAGK